MTHTYSVNIPIYFINHNDWIYGHSIFVTWHFDWFPIHLISTYLNDLWINYLKFLFYFIFYHLLFNRLSLILCSIFSLVILVWMNSYLLVLSYSIIVFKILGLVVPITYFIINLGSLRNLIFNLLAITHFMKWDLDHLLLSNHHYFKK